MRIKVISTAFAWACCTWLAVSQAQTIHQADFDEGGTLPSFGYSYAYAGYGDATGDYGTNDEVSATNNITAPPTATGTATATLDASEWDLPPVTNYTYLGWGLGIGLFLNEGTRPTSADLSEYTVSFDASVAGYLNDGLSTEVTVILQAPDDDDEDTAAEEYRIDLASRPILTDETQSLEFNLGDFGLPAEPNFDFPTDFEDTFILILQVAPNTNAAQTGLDDDNVITVDNVLFEGPFAVPFGGDFDFDTFVDGNDLLVWQRGETPETGSPGELATWKANYGRTAPGVSAVPEPTGWVLTSIAALALLAGGPRRGARSMATSKA